MPNVITRERALIQNEYYSRVSQPDGNRTFQQDPDTASGILVDNHGRLITTAATPYGYDIPIQSQGIASFRQQQGSGYGYDAVGLVQEHVILQSPASTGRTYAAPVVIRIFGYCAAAGWVQVVRSDWSGGVALPLAGTQPCISIAVTANSNYVFGNWPLITAQQASALLPGVLDQAYYIAFSSTGPTYTPGGANLWFNSLAAV